MDLAIRIKGFLQIRTAMGGSGELELELPGSTLQEVVFEVCDRYGEALRKLVMDAETGTIRSDYVILINGRHYRTLPRGLDSEVCDGDFVAIFPPMAGG